MLFSMAWKNIWRNKTRSIIILVAIVLGLLGGLVASGVSFGMGDQMMRSTIETRVSHIQIRDSAFVQEQIVRDSIPGALDLVSQIEQLRNIAGVAPRIVVTAMASSPTNATGLELYGVVPQSEKGVSQIPRLIQTGEYLAAGMRNEAVISQELARMLDLRIGSRVVFTFQSAEGEITGGAFRVSGLFKTTSSAFDRSVAYVLADDLARLLETDLTFQNIAILLTTNNALDTTVTALRTMAPSMQIDTWRNIAPELDYLSSSLSTVLYIFMVVILLALAFGIVNTMLMVVLERRRELGMLMAVGMPRKMVFSIIVLETIILSLTGAVVGMLLAMIVLGILQQTGIDLSLFAAGLREFGISEVLYPSLPWSMYPILAVMVTLTAILAALYPAYQALRLHPAQALRL